MKRLKVTLGAMVAVAFVASMDAEGHSGETIEIAGNRIRLHGIDAPEGRQSCRRVDGTSWFCGRAAARALRGMIAGGRVCSMMGRCLCGAVPFTAKDVETDAHGCHCSQSCRWSGASAIASCRWTICEAFLGVDSGNAGLGRIRN